jgi:hypothetical protein
MPEDIITYVTDDPHAEITTKTAEQAIRDDEAEACAKIAENELRRIVDGPYDQGRVDAAYLIFEAIGARIKAREVPDMRPADRVLPESPEKRS